MHAASIATATKPPTPGSACLRPQPRAYNVLKSGQHGEGSDFQICQGANFAESLKIIIHAC